MTAKKASQYKMEKKKHLPEPQNSRVFQVALLHILNSPPEIEENNHKMNDTERISSLETKPKKTTTTKPIVGTTTTTTKVAATSLTVASSPASLYPRADEHVPMP